MIDLSPSATVNLSGAEALGGFQIGIFVMKGTSDERFLDGYNKR